MQMVVERDELLRAVGHVAGVVKAKSDIPILTQLVLRAERESGTVRGTDVDMEVSAPFKATVTEPGVVCVGARLLHDIVKRMPADKQISLTFLDDQLRIVCGRSRFQLATLPAEDYPSFGAARGDELCVFELEAERLRGLLSGVRHAVSKQETRYYLCGVYLHVTAEETPRLRTVATNGHVLAMQQMLAPTGAYSMQAIILPSATVSEMLKLLPDNGQLVQLTVGRAFVWLDVPGGLRLGSKLIDGTYPEYDRVIPRGYSNRVSVDVDRLNVAVDRVSTLGDSDFRSIALRVNPAKGEIRVSMERGGHGSASDLVEGADIDGAKATIGVNARYLIEMLRSYAGGTVEIRYDARNAGSAPMLMTLAGADIGLQVLMPLRVNERDAFDEAA